MKTILVGYDDTPSARIALERAAELTNALAAKLIVTSVAPVLVSVGRSGGLIDPADPPDEHEAALRQARSYLWTCGVNDAEFVNLVGPPANTIVRLATLRNADLIIVGSRGTNLVGRLLRHSVSDSVVHKARCEVLVVREHEPHVGVADDAARRIAA
jgi:nucleotide-binding universal stress UspA family protein